MFKNFLDNINNNPVMLAGIVQAIVPVLVVFQLVNWTEAQTAVLYTAITAVLTAFVRGNTVAAPRVEQKVQERMAQREMAGTTGTGTGMTPAATPGPATPGMTLLLVALALGGMLVAGCGPKLPPNVSPEGKAAFHATRVVDGLRAVLPLVKPLVCVTGSVPDTCIAPDDAVVVVKAVERAADVALKLGPVLSAVDNSVLLDDKVTGMAKARALMAEINGILMNATVTPDYEPARRQLVQLFANVTALLFAVQ